EDLLRGMHGGRSTGMGHDAVPAFGDLYRQSTSDLAVARRDYPYDPVTSYLNGLVARAHPFVYRGEAMDVGRLAGFYRTTFPQAFRRMLPFASPASLLTLIPAPVGSSI